MRKINSVGILVAGMSLAVIVGIYYVAMQHEGAPALVTYSHAMIVGRDKDVLVQWAEDQHDDLRVLLIQFQTRAAGNAVDEDKRMELRMRYPPSPAESGLWINGDRVVLDEGLNIYVRYADQDIPQRVQMSDHDVQILIDYLLADWSVKKSVEKVEKFISQRIIPN